MAEALSYRGRTDFSVAADGATIWVGLGVSWIGPIIFILFIFCFAWHVYPRPRPPYFHVIMYVVSSIKAGEKWEVGSGSYPS